METVKTFIQEAAQRAHVEITTLIVPGENDGEAEMDALAAWLASLDNSIPLHLSRCFPRYHASFPPTPRDTMEKLRDIAEKHLSHVYLGNI